MAAATVDLVIRNGTVVDGTGAAPFAADVAVSGGVIVGVGPRLAARGAREVDAAGRHVMPGWVDIHTHYDAQLMWDPVLAPSGPSGVTTVVTGNCGAGIAPTRAKPRDREWMMSLFSAIEDIPTETLRAGIRWSVDGKEWESFPEYLDALGKMNFACDVAALVPHSCVRGYVLGPDRASLSDAPGGPVSHPLTAAEKRAVAQCCKEGIEAGAVGVATNRFIGHRDSKGVLAAGSLADADEVVMIARAMAEAGGGTLEMATDFALYDDLPYDKMDPAMRKAHSDREWRWVRFVAGQYGIPVNWAGDTPLKTLDEAARAGLPIFNQWIVRPQAFICNFPSCRAGKGVFAHAPIFRELGKAPFGEMLARLREPATRDAILAQLEERMAEKRTGPPSPLQFWGNPDTWKTFYPIGDGWTYEPTPDQSVSAIAQREGRSVLRVVYDHMLTRGGAGTVWRGTENLQQFYDWTRKRLAHPRVVPGVSDAGAHLAIFQDGTTPSAMASFWARDRKHGSGTLPLELCVQKQTRDTAHLYGLTDRGTIEVGKKADINVVDMAALRIHAPEFVHDLPSGAPRWDQRVSGYEMTVCSGVVTFEKGTHTGALPGRLVKNPNQGRVRGGLPEVPAEFTGYRVAKAGGATADDMLEHSMKAGSGISNMSRIVNAGDGDKRAKL